MTKGLRILHTADWHLGKVLRDRPRDEEHGKFFTWLLDLIQTEEIDVLLISGDLFDSPNPSTAAQQLYYNVIRDIRQRRQCTVIVTAGNHDSPSHIDAPKRLLRALSTEVVGSAPEDPADTLIYLPDREHPMVAIAAIPFLRDRDVRRGRPGEGEDEIRSALIAGISGYYQAAAEAHQRNAPGVPLIGMGHLTISQGHRCDSEREIHIGGLGALGADRFSEEYRYIALGHLHGPQAHGAQQRVRYSGSPIPLSFSEATHQKEVVILHVEGNELRVEPRAIPSFRRLIRLSCEGDAIEQTLLAINPGETLLPPWIELTVTGTITPEEIEERISSARSTAAARGGAPATWELIKVQRAQNLAHDTDNSAAAGGWGDSETDSVSHIDALLENPVAVFQRVLHGKEEAYSEEEQDQLVQLFTTVLEMVHQEAGS